MRQLAFCFYGSIQIVWEVDVDTKIVGLSTSIQVIVSTNPTLVVGDFTLSTASLPRIREDVLLYSAAATTTRPDLEIPVLKGQKLYLTSVGQGGCLLYLSDSQLS